MAKHGKSLPLSWPWRIGRWLCVSFFIGLVAFCVVGLFLPYSLDVTVTRETRQPIEKIYERLGDLRNWPSWLPWHAEDPGMAISYSGMQNGVGMVMSWDSQRHGEGRVTISDVEQDEKVSTSVEFHRQGSCTADFRLEPAPKQGSRITLRFLSEYGQNYAGRYIGWLSRGYVEKMLTQSLENIELSVEKAEDRKRKREERVKAVD